MNWRDAVAVVDIARWRLMQRYPWARRTLSNLQLIEAPGIGTLGVDPWLRLYVDPEIVAQWKGRMEGVLWHECNHVMRRHFDRMSRERGFFSPQAANVAGDLEINGEMEDNPLSPKLPDGCLHPDTFPWDQAAKWKDGSRKNAEWYYRNLPRRGGAVKGLSDAQIPDCGSGAGGEGLPCELDAPGSEGQARVGRVMDGQDRDILSEVESRGYSTGISEALYREVVERVRGGHDWRSILGAEIRNCIEQVMDEQEEYTFRRPSRRQAAISDEVVLPSGYRPIPSLAVVVDVSGSMDKPKLVASMRELHAILNRLAIPEYVAISWNTVHVGSFRISGDKDIPNVYARVGGGTDMVAGMAHAISTGADIIVVLSDCECRWTDAPQGPPIVVGGIHRNTDPRTHAPWVRVVDVETA